jgi:hypothetical protein
MTSGTPPAALLAALLAERVDSLVPILLPAARRSGAYWQVGNVFGDAGASLYIHRGGPKAGRWTDTAAGEFGDLLDLINAALFGGRDMREAMRWAAEWLGLDPSRPPPAMPPRAARQAPHQHDGDEAAIAVARNVWAASAPAAGSLAEVYLRSRAITLAPPPTLRYAPALTHYLSGRVLPALVAAISGADQRVTAVQRIFLRPDGGRKADIEDPKLTLGRMLDGACRLAALGPALGLAEGVETGLSAMQLHGLPVWAACGSRLDAVRIPDDVERLVIFADNGAAGERAAERAAFAHMKPNRVVEVRRPPAGFKDFNDQLRASIERGAA